MYKGGLWLVALFNIKYHEHVQILWLVFDIHTIQFLTKSWKEGNNWIPILGQASEVYEPLSACNWTWTVKNIISY